jgi:uncharacterized protein YjbJ (UPF0337 family)
MGDTTRKGSTQNKVEGKAKELGGRVRRAVGDLTGDRSERLKGAKDEVKGRAQKRLGKAQRDVEELDKIDSRTKRR